jgi:pimeloyl-ACP methyl ester carboxylesterase
LLRPDFFHANVPAPDDFECNAPGRFSFHSLDASPWSENNRALGKLYRTGARWQHRPSAVLLHGWNGEPGFRLGFPVLARLLNRRGINAAVLQLPYHGRRKPRAAGAQTNFICGDPLHVISAVRQAVTDIRALLGWLTEQGSPRIGLWGISLGAWLGGLVACHDPRADFVVLMSPVARIDRAVRELEFFASLRRQIDDETLQVDRLNLAAQVPQAGPQRVLIIESRHDLFAPVATIEELWRAWGQPEIWRLPHGHISVLLSLPVLHRTVKWIASKVGQASRLDPFTGARQTS